MQAACMDHRLDLCKRSGTHMAILSTILNFSYPPHGTERYASRARRKHQEPRQSSPGKAEARLQGDVQRSLRHRRGAREALLREQSRGGRRAEARACWTRVKVLERRGGDNRDRGDVISGLMGTFLRVCASFAIHRPL